MKVRGLGEVEGVEEGRSQMAREPFAQPAAMRVELSQARQVQIVFGGRDEKAG